MVVVHFHTRVYLTCECRSVLATMYRVRSSTFRRNNEVLDFLCGTCRDPRGLVTLKAITTVWIARRYRSRRYVFVYVFASKHVGRQFSSTESQCRIHYRVSGSSPLRPQPFPEATAETFARLLPLFLPPVPAYPPVRLSPPAPSSPPPRSVPGGGGSASKARVASSINKPSARAHTYTHESRARTLGLRAGVYTNGTRVHTVGTAAAIHTLDFA